jgi:4-amino-4-deoxy-L-arabinose transferase-like glycosyltransferase
LLLFWGIAVFNLNRYPMIHEDEPWILSPGYKLFAQGVYGSDLFTGFFNIERVYLEFMPLMSFLQGALTRVYGIGIFQIRFLPVGLGLLTLALTFRIGRELFSARAGFMALLLLLFWQWTPAGEKWFESGVPLVDLSRIARYDILVAPLGLGALLCIVRAHAIGNDAASNRWRYDLLGGVLGGLAGLAHIYGLFWVLALALIYGLEAARDHAPRRLFRQAGLFLLGGTLVWVGWLAALGLNLPDYLGQNYQYRDRFDLLSPSFYLDNLIAEPRRYNLGVRELTTYARGGFWLLVVGLPAAAWWLVRSARHGVEARALYLLAPAFVLPAAFALVIGTKQYNYVAPLVPLFALVVAWALVQLLAERRTWPRLAASAWFLVVCAQGILGLAQMQLEAGRAEPPEPTFALLRTIIPESARVLGMPRYWLARPEQDYRSYVVLFQLTDPRITPAPLSVTEALTRIAPTVVLMDSDLRKAYTDRTSPLSRERSDEYAAFMLAHRAQLVTEIPDERGNRMQIYQLEP